LSVAYIDSSCLLAVLFDEPVSRETLALMQGHEDLVSSNLLEAEVRSALARENVTADPAFLRDIDWVLPARPLTDEMRRTLSVGYLRGSDLWHIATALYLTEVPSDLPFLTLDRRQRDVASALGFPTPLPLPTF
jgi:predicted nucleic acid-binding protein